VPGGDVAECLFLAFADADSNADSACNGDCDAKVRSF
jgi:hypothetical protein